MQKQLLYIWIVCGPLFFGYNCSGDENPAETEVDCTLVSIEDFDHFLGISYGDEEHLLSAKLGQQTGGFYTPDSLGFVYLFNRVERVPISIWVSTETKKVITVFMEVVSLGKNFDEDLSLAVQEFDMDNCQSEWFGLTAAEIKSRLGQPSEEATDEAGVTLLSYDSKDFLYTVAFKIYPQQEGKCSSVSVNWFYY